MPLKQTHTRTLPCEPVGRLLGRWSKIILHDLHGRYVWSHFVFLFWYYSVFPLPFLCGALCITRVHRKIMSAICTALQPHHSHCDNSTVPEYVKFSWGSASALLQIFFHCSSPGNLFKATCPTFSGLDKACSPNLIPWPSPELLDFLDFVGMGHQDGACVCVHAQLVIRPCCLNSSWTESKILSSHTFSRPSTVKLLLSIYLASSVTVKNVLCQPDDV